MNTSIVSNFGNNRILILLSILMGLFLNQSNVIFGVNISFADIFAVLLLLFLLLYYPMELPVSPLLFFIVVSISVLATSVFYVPNIYEVVVKPIQIYSNYVKLIAVFTFLILGYNLAKLNIIKKVLKWFSIFGVIIGSVGISLFILKVNIFSDLLFYAGIRYRGLMNDPNYFSILQIIAIVYFSRTKNLNFKYRTLAIIVLLIGVIISGSKTGIIVAGCYGAFRLFEYTLVIRKSKKSIIASVLVTIIFILMTPFFLKGFQGSLDTIQSYIPSFSRVQTLFTDFSGAISESGSGRNNAWATAIELIKLSPLIGVGLGNYTLLSSTLYGVGAIAHNTYLQLMVEWGLPLAVTFFVLIFIMLIKVSLTNNRNNENLSILRDSLIILLMGSFAISLNNARIFWLILGALIFYIGKHARTINK
ncbi:MAG: O-antigen ligase family protein [Bacillota bacterium]